MTQPVSNTSDKVFDLPEKSAVVESLYQALRSAAASNSFDVASIMSVTGKMSYKEGEALLELAAVLEAQGLAPTSIGELREAVQKAADQREKDLKKKNRWWIFGEIASAATIVTGLLGSIAGIIAKESAVAAGVAAAAATPVWVPYMILTLFLGAGGLLLSRSGIGGNMRNYGVSE